ARGGSRRLPRSLRCAERRPRRAARPPRTDARRDRRDRVLGDRSAASGQVRAGTPAHLASTGIAATRGPLVWLASRWVSQPRCLSPARRRRPVRGRTVPTLVVAALISLALAIPDHAGAAGSGARIRSSLNVIGPQNDGGEPSVAISPDHTIYVSAPGDAMEFWRSADGGKTWAQGASPESPSGDTSVNVDQSGAVYESNLNVITGDQNTLQVDLFKSFDRSATWPQKGSSAIEDTNASGQPALVDRQWTDAWIPPGHSTNTATVCMTYHDFGPSQMWVSCSFDGGRHFDLPVDAITSPLAQADSYCNTIPGGLKIVSSGPHAGRIYIAWLAADPANPLTGCNLTQLAAFHSIWSAYSDDGGQSWTDQLVYDAGPLHDGSEIFADLTLDNQG